MSTNDTELGGERKTFPATSWGLISNLANPAASGHIQGLHDLCARYWKPVYYYIRIAWDKPNEEAKDLTQEFFTFLLEGRALALYAPNRGSFRKYLKLLLRHFLEDQRKAATRLKRAGAVKFVPLTEDVTELEAFLRDPAARDPEEAFDRAWAMTIARRAMERVRERFAATGRETQFRAFEAYDLTPEGERPTYAEVASRLGVKEGDVRNYLFAVRDAVRAEVRNELAIVTRDESEADEEWADLFRSP